jgi:hypothetical protein
MERPKIELKSGFSDRPKIECDECGTLTYCSEVFGMYFCDECNARLYGDIDRRVKIKSVKIDDML